MDPGSKNSHKELKYFIKNPTKVRRSFALVCYYLNEQGKRKYVDGFKDERISAINLKYKKGELDFGTARLLVEEVEASLIRKNGTLGQILKKQKLSDVNENLFMRFWDDVYAEKILADEQSAKLDFRRALRLIGSANIYTAKAKDLTAELKKNCKSASQHRRAADRLNEILRYLKREIELAKPAAPIIKVKYLNEAEVLRLAAQAPCRELEWAVLTLFGTGARLGEAIALGPTDVKGVFIYINKQIRADGTEAPPKRGKTGPAPIISSTKKAIGNWAKVEDKQKYRDAIYDFVFSASRRLWPHNKEKQISPHDLRHSYAIHCLSCGHTLDMVRKSLRNTTAICEKYYTGFAHTEMSLELAAKLL